MSYEYRVRVALPADEGALLAVVEDCAEAPRWSHGLWQELLEGDGAGERTVLIAEVGGEVVGFIVVSLAAGVAEIESVAVLTTARRMGIGRALCVEGMRWARRRGAEVMELEVRASSEGALALYAALGFAEQGMRRGYYRDPVDDAVLLAASLSGTVGSSE